MKTSENISIVENIYFCLKPLLDILLCVFSICSHKQTEELDDTGFATESTHSFLNIKINRFQKNPL